MAFHSARCVTTPRGQSSNWATTSATLGITPAGSRPRTRMAMTQLRSWAIRLRNPLPVCANHAQTNSNSLTCSTRPIQSVQLTSHSLSRSKKVITASKPTSTCWTSTRSNNLKSNISPKQARRRTIRHPGRMNSSYPGLKKLMTWMKLINCKTKERWKKLLRRCNQTQSIKVKIISLSEIL